MATAPGCPDGGGDAGGDVAVRRAAPGGVRPSAGARAAPVVARAGIRAAGRSSAGRSSAGRRAAGRGVAVTRRE
ncbi:MAG: hypothetical protein ACM3ZF_06180, partial [Mycobacterium leprae]